MASAELDKQIFEVNPYDGHPSLTQLEAEVLWEYAKLSQHVKILLAKTRQLSEEPDQRLLNQLRTLETKMGLVLTLFKASVWGVINEQPVSEPSLSFETGADDTTMQQ